MKRLLWLLVLIPGLLIGCSSSTGPRNPDAVISDADVERDISKKLFEHKDEVPNWNRITIRCLRGKVVLRGRVDTQAEADRAISLADSVWGTKSVVSELRVGME